MGKQTGKRSTTWLVGISAGVLVAACGGGKKGDTTPSGDEGATLERSSGPINDSDSAEGMIPPETMEEISNLLGRKQGLMSRCYADGVERGDRPKNSRGKMSLEIVISPSGRAETVTVAKASFDAPAIAECVIGHIKKIQFPEVPRTYPTSYTYAFEAM